MKLLKYSVLIPLVVFLGGCEPKELEAVRNLAKLESTGSQIFPKIAEDILETCNRTASYNNIQLSTNYNEEARELIAKKPNEYFIPYYAQLAQCKEDHEPAKQSVENANKVILEYLGSLGDLAQDNSINYDKQIENVANGIVAFPKVKDGENDANVEAVKISAVNIAQSLANFFTNEYRRDKLADVIIESDADLATIIDALDETITNNYQNGLLNTELLEYQNYYVKSIENFCLKFKLECQGVVKKDDLDDLLKDKKLLRFDPDNPQHQRLKQEFLTSIDSYLSAEQIIMQRKQLASSYIALLRKIKRDHLYLVFLFTDEPSLLSEEENTTAELSKKIKSYSKDLESLEKQYQKLYPAK